MLTLDLIQTRKRGNKIFPHYLDTKSEELFALARTLIDIFQNHQGLTKGELTESLGHFLGESKQILVYRGLSRILENRCTFDTDAVVDPMIVRQMIFKLAGRAYFARAFDRKKIIEEAAMLLETSPKMLEKALYADLKDHQVLQTIKEISPKHLLEKYNTSVAQTILLKATSLEIHIKKNSNLRYRQLFRAIKFRRLLYQISGNTKDGFKIVLDGPMSLFSACQKYGIQMALFLPALLLCDHWHMKAELKWKNGQPRSFFLLDSKAGLQSHAPDSGMYQPPEMQVFCKRFQALKSDWEISDECCFLELGDKICIPDYVFVNTTSNCVVYLEIFGFWRKSLVEQRISQLGETNKNLLLAISKNLKTERTNWQPDHRKIFFFRQVLPPKEILKKLDGYLTS